MMDGLFWKGERLMKESARGGISLFGLLFLLFLGLKLGGIIHWSWWWVTAPLWGPWALLLGIVLVLAIVGGFVWYLKHD